MTDSREKDRRFITQEISASGAFAVASFGNNDQAIQDELRRLLCGNVKEKPIAWLLQVANEKKANGQLLVGNSHHITCIQFINGKPIHAQSPSKSGPEAIYRLFELREGKVKYEADGKPTHQTVKNSFEELFSYGQEYLNSLQFLDKNRIDHLSVLSRNKDKDLNQDLENTLSHGFPLDKKIQIEYLNKTTGIVCLQDLRKKLALEKSKSTIIVANLLKLGLLLGPQGQSLKCIVLPQDELNQEIGYDEEDDFAEGEPDNPSPPANIMKDTAEFAALAQSQVVTAPTGPSAQVHAPKLVNLGVPKKLIALEENSSHATLSKLKDDETGILSVQSFHYFLELEFARAFRFSTNFSLVLFAIVTDDEGRGILPSQDLGSFLQKIDDVRRDVDIFGQLGDKVYGFILPNIESADARNLAKRIQGGLAEIVPDVTVWKPRLLFGIASVPQDARDLASLIKGAQLALTEAITTEEKILEYQEYINRR